MKVTMNLDKIRVYSEELEAYFEIKGIVLINNNTVDTSSLELTSVYGDKKNQKYIEDNYQELTERIIKRELSLK